MTAENQTCPSSFPCQAVPLGSSCLQGAPQDPAPQRELLAWPLTGSLGPLYSAQSSPLWEQYRPVGSDSHLVLTGCSSWISQVDWFRTMQMCRGAADRKKTKQFELLSVCLCVLVEGNITQIKFYWCCDIFIFLSSNLMNSGNRLSLLKLTTST